MVRITIHVLSRLLCARKVTEYHINGNTYYVGMKNYIDIDWQV